MIIRLQEKGHLPIEERLYLVERGNELRALRKKAKLTIKQLAELLCTSNHIIQNVEQGRQRKEDIITQWATICNEIITKL